LLDGEQTANKRIAFELDAKPAQVLNFRVDNRVGKPEIRNAVFEHTSGLMKCLEDRHITSGFGHVRRTSHAGGSRTDNSYLEAVWLDIRNIGPFFLDRIVADPALQAT